MATVKLRRTATFIRTSSRLWSDETGNLALTAAIVLPVLLGAMAMTINYTTAMNDQRHLQDAIDAAAVAAAASLAASKHDETTVKAYAKNFALVELATSLTATQLGDLSSKIGVSVTTTGTGSSKGYTIKINRRLHRGSEPIREVRWLHRFTDWCGKYHLKPVNGQERHVDVCGAGQVRSDVVCDGHCEWTFGEMPELHGGKLVELSQSRCDEALLCQQMGALRRLPRAFLTNWIWSKTRTLLTRSCAPAACYSMTTCKLPSQSHDD
jgi:hypothetical protein